MAADQWSPRRPDGEWHGEDAADSAGVPAPARRPALAAGTSASPLLDDTAFDETAPTAERADSVGHGHTQPTDWWDEVKGVFWLILAVLGFHSLVAKPFYIPSESMMPGLLVGDRLVVTKYPYGWSFVSPTFHLLPPFAGRLWGEMPERGDVVIVTPPGTRTDYIKRVIGLPGDRLQVRDGTVFLNGVAVPRRALGDRLVPIDANTQCDPDQYPGRRVNGPNGPACSLPIFRETLPNGRSYDTVDLRGSEPGDFYGPVTVPAGHLFLMGDNRDNSADSRFAVAENGLGGPVPWENIGGRAEFVTFSLNGEVGWNPLSWASSFRPGRAGGSLHPDEASSR